jgi:hypothetical protein
MPTLNPTAFVSSEDESNHDESSRSNQGWSQRHAPARGRRSQNTVKWLIGGSQPVSIQGAGLLEAFAYKTEPGFALHLVNYTNPNLHRGTIRAFYPVGPQSVSFAIPESRSISRIQLLKAETDIPFRRVGGRVEFTVPSVTEHEVVAIYA